MQGCVGCGVLLRGFDNIIMSSFACFGLLVLLGTTTPLQHCSKQCLYNIVLVFQHTNKIEKRKKKLKNDAVIAMRCESEVNVALVFMYCIV